MSDNVLPLILDCDTGEDDAIAIVLSVLAELPLKYIVTCHGNTTLDNATDNSSRILSLLDAKEIKIIKGSSKPIQPHKWESPSFTAGTDFLGYNGLCNMRLSRSKFDNVKYFGQNIFIRKLAEIIKTEQKIDYIITGPCTNFALVCDYFGPELKKYIRNLYIMGGAIYAPGTRGAGVKNTSHENGKKWPETWAEFNFYCDPFSVKKVLSYSFNPIVITWDQCIQFELPFEIIRKMKSKTIGGKFIIRLMHAFMKLYGMKNKTKFELCDPLTIMAYIGCGNIRSEKINIITGKKYFGKSFPDPKGFSVRYFYVNDNKEVQSIISSMIRKLGITISG